MRGVDVAGADAELVGVEVELDADQRGATALDLPGVLLRLAPGQRLTCVVAYGELLHLPRELPHEVRPRDPDRKAHVERKRWIVNLHRYVHEVRGWLGDRYVVTDSRLRCLTSRKPMLA